MRRVFASTLVLLALSFPLSASGAHPRTPSEVTLVLNFDDEHSELSIEEMKRELSAIMKDSGVQFQFKTRAEFGADSSGELVVVRFHGRCRMENLPVLYDERGPLAFTHSSDGDVLPFSDVACERVKVSIRSAMFGGDLRRGDLLLGRALGRVVAHELYHIMVKTSGHGTAGVAQPALSGRQLISERLALRPEDVDKLTQK